VHAAEQFLLSHLIEAIEVGVISGVAQHLFHLHGSVPIAALAEASGLGLRQFERRVQQDFGMSPKVFARVARFQAAVDRKIAQPSSPWVDIAHDFGYHDQMHMIHDFEKLGGEAPAKFLTQLGNMRFTALSES
jgi:transcriptional regulator GlxA family with amidase domain